MRGIFVTAPGTGCGKTTVARAITLAARHRGIVVRALKPIETGVDPHAEDAAALADASGDPSLASDPAWYRARPALSPYAAELEQTTAPMNLEAVVAAIRRRAGPDTAIVEGAGGWMSPLTRVHTNADLGLALGMPLLVVARDRLGVLADVLATVECAERRASEIAAIVLTRRSDTVDASTRTNARILSERLRCPVLPFEIPAGASAEEHARAAEKAELLDSILARGRFA